MNAFELVFAFDEVISMGNKEKLNIAQVKQFLVMDSQEEMMAEALQRSKEREAAADAERRRKELEAMRAEEARSGRSSNPMFSRGAALGQSMSSSGMGGGSMSSGGMGGGNMRGSGVTSGIGRSSTPSSSAPTSNAPARKGLSLTSTAPKASDYMETMKQEMGASANEMKELMRQQNSPAPATSGSAASAHIPPATMRDDVHVSISEKLLVRLDKDGNVQHFEVRGELDVHITKESYAQIAVRLNPKAMQGGLDWKIHPNYNKPKFMESATVQFRDANKAYTVNAPNGALKWRLMSQDSSRLPLLVNCWPSAGAGTVASVAMEYEARKGVELHDVLVRIPIVAKGQPNVTACNGDANYDSKNTLLEWSVPLIDSSNLNGNLDFELDQWRSNDTSHLFPINVQFTSTSSLCDIGVLQVFLGDQPVKFSTHTVVSVESYTIE